MASDLDPYAYEASDEASETELLDKSLSVWKGWSSLESDEDFRPIPLDLHTAASIGSFDCVRAIIDKNEEDLNEKNWGGWTPLMYAAYIGHDNVVNLLLEANVSVNIRNKKGQTALHLAASCGNESVAYFLLQNGAELEARDSKGWTALFHATYSGHQQLVKFLLDNNTNMEATEPYHGLTPFMEAAAEGHEIIVHTFLQHGVNVHAKALNGDTAQTLALQYGHMKLVSMIDNHMNPHPHRTDGIRGDLSSSDEAYQRPRHKGSRSRMKGPNIQDGPAAFAKLMNKSKTPPSDTNLPDENASVPSGYVTFHNDGTEVVANQPICSRDMTSPINAEDHRLDSSGGAGSKDSVRDVDDDIDDAFSKTGALTIKSSSSSSGGLVAALGIHKEESPESNDSSAPELPEKNTLDPIPAEERKPKAPMVRSPNRHDRALRHQRSREWRRKDTRPNNHEVGSGDRSNQEVNHSSLQTLPSQQPPHQTSASSYPQRDRVTPSVPPGLSPLSNNHNLDDLPTLDDLLTQLGLTKYIPLFQEQDVDLQVFMSLTDNDLKEVGVKLFGPRRKMTNAIARWHSNAAPASNSLEQAYADKLEAEMQEMALNLHQAYDQAEKCKAQVLQEQELRSVTEGCLMEDRKTWQQVHRIAMDTRQHCGELANLVQRLSLLQNELTRRLLLSGDVSQPMENPYAMNPNTLAAALQDSVHLDQDTNNEIQNIATEHLVNQLEYFTGELKRAVTMTAVNTDKLLGREMSCHDEFEALS
ncbi:ankyrin repeat and SAM domain-containing protein 3-like [Lineus longissimus]|uniref:ankyrin repeat and SAM domain-containing protein 3-like n=1 Tax=Lineus longissimus TaxID=88925 RepID=UPI002B4D8484